jgi:hypothetical protein
MRVIVTLCLFYLLACENPPFDRYYPIDIQNNSTHSITFYVPTPGFRQLYPDTTLPLAKPSMQIVPSGESRSEYSSYPWEQAILEYPADTLSIYLFHFDTLNTNTWDQIRAGYKVLRRYDLSIQDLQNRNFRINYP